MDWGAALAGIDSELQQRIKNNAAQTGTSLDVLRTGADLRNAQADNLRADQAAGDLSRYRDNEIQVRNRAVARNEATDAVKQADKDELDKLSAAWAAMPEGPEKAQAGALLSARIKGFKQIGGSVLSVVTKPDGTQTLVNLGAKGANDTVVKPTGAGAGQQGYVPDAKALQDAADGARAGDMTLWNALVARGAAGNATRQALSEEYGRGRPDDYTGVAAARANLKADTATQTALKKSIATQAAMHEATMENYDVMKQAMSKIPDLGNPMFNKPIRMIDAALLDPAAMGAFNMARVSVIREYTRLTSSNLEAKGQVTDEGRRAYETLLNEDTPLPTAIAMMDVMNRDMTNLQGALEHQSEKIDKDIAERGKAKPAGTTTPTATGGAVANHPASVGTPVHQEFKGLPPLVPGAPGSKGKADPTRFAAFTAKFFGATPTPEQVQTTKDYLTAMGYVF